ncbi:hypothetical protein F0562_028239 [Nyssa sinensis]|uniref:Beta-carotene isomerase D27-like C-terminal domain-containing protein n=1 Tax=Nyssa sinensis TaxID=561372 RepID=A0A5J5B9X5_9ASTE|nr:hypothetical protein F0562_028239 [Nyssa sinensis]
MLVAPIGGEQVAALMVGQFIILAGIPRAELGDCTILSGVFVERCKYLEESKCVGICINTCKLPTQFKFGVLAPLPEDDSAIKEPCLEICPNANRRREGTSNMDASPCRRA